MLYIHGYNSIQRNSARVTLDREPRKMKLRLFFLLSLITAVYGTNYYEKSYGCYLVFKPDCPTGCGHPKQQIVQSYQESIPGPTGEENCRYVYENLRYNLKSFQDKKVTCRPTKCCEKPWAEWPTSMFHGCYFLTN